MEAVTVVKEQILEGYRSAFLFKDIGESIADGVLAALENLALARIDVDG